MRCDPGWAVALVGDEDDCWSKTTITANLGVDLAQRGMKVLLIDLDPQASLTFSFYDPDYWRENLRDRHTMKQWFDGLGDGVPRVELGTLVVTPDAVNSHVAHPRGRVDLIASHLGLIRVDLELATEAAAGGRHEAKLFGVCGALAGALGHHAFAEYDVILFDCPPNFNIVTQTAIIASDHLVIPAKADYLSTLGIEYLYGNVRNRSSAITRTPANTQQVAMLARSNPTSLGSSST